MVTERVPASPPEREAPSTGNQPFALAALQYPSVATLLRDHRALLTDLVEGLGSPLHIALPEIFQENLTGLRRAFSDAGADANILFAKKADKADCFVRSAAAANTGVDAASAPELVKALAGGVPGYRIGISGPENDDTLHALAIHHGSVIAVDSVSELRRMVAAAGQAQRAAWVLLRSRADSQPTSRFGMAAAERDIAVRLYAEHATDVALQGFSFHFSGYSTTERAAAVSDMDV